MITVKEPFIFLETKNTSYIMKIAPLGMLAHVYYGKKIPQDDLSYYTLHRDWAFSAVIPVGDSFICPQGLAQEYPTYGRGDYRQPALVLEDGKGRQINHLAYVSHEIKTGKSKLPGMPSLDRHVENVQTLEITMADEITGAQVKLCYCVFEEEDVISRYVVISNGTDQVIRIHRADSLSVDIEMEDMELITLQGAWARERHVVRRPVCQGISSVESRRGSSSAQMNPFGALVRKTTTEDYGDAYGVSLIYSSDFKLSAEGNEQNFTRLQVGINPETFAWKLEPGASFTTPEALITYSAEGLGKMSRNFHRVCRNHLGKCAQKNLRHPIVINNWEATYFDIDQQKLEQLLKSSQGLGIDTLVLDDGWFGHRDNDDSSLGDWYTHEKKFPNGLKPIADLCAQYGMDFGIWFEPEMISKDSDLYREHPDWCIHCEGVEPRESRRQRVLDLSRPEVVDYIYEKIAAVLNSCDIRYVKWDCNRSICDNGSISLPADRQMEHGHRQVLGLYELMNRFITNFPHVFFEGCSGGGGRNDFGILYYMPQIWTSDDSDPVERLRIQYGTSFAYPPSTMVGHVSASPNHQTARITPFETRGEVAQMCNYGYELDIGKLSDEEKSMILQQTAQHKALEPLIRDGEFYRLASPFEGNLCSWELVSEDQSRAYVMVAFQTAGANNVATYLRLKGLKEMASYRVEPLNITLSGATLMNAGLPVRMPYRDHAAWSFNIFEE